jgi:hypothetical protein
MTDESTGAAHAAVGDDERADLLRSGWTVPQPETIPDPTAAPAAVALGVTLAAFGGLTSWILSAVGAVVAVAALVRWFKEMHDAAER